MNLLILHLEERERLGRRNEQARRVRREPDMTGAAPFDLERLVTAQAAVFPAVLAELKAGRKRTHWMWFVFPQLRGLGHSSVATFCGIASLHEARAYLGNPLLGPRLDLCTRIVLELEAGSLHEIFGSPDDLKFQSSVDAVRLGSSRVGSGRAG